MDLRPAGLAKLRRTVVNVVPDLDTFQIAPVAGKFLWMQCKRRSLHDVLIVFERNNQDISVAGKQAARVCNITRPLSRIDGDDGTPIVKGTKWFRHKVEVIATDNRYGEIVSDEGR